MRPARILTVRLVIAPVLITALAASASATVHVVNPEGTGDYPTIQAAISAAANGDTVALTNGTFTGPGNKNIDYLGKAIIAKSISGHPEVCLIDCEASYASPHRGFHFHSAEGPQSVLEGVTIKNANLSGIGVYENGGAIRCAGTSAPTLRNCIFMNNAACLGAGAFCADSSAPTLQYCTFSGNYAHGEDLVGGGSGGGLGCLDDSSPVVTECIFSDNRAYSGGGVYLGNDSHAELTGCTLIRNQGSYYGGGIGTADYSTLTVTGCTLVGNIAHGFGSGLACWSNTQAPIENTIVAFGCCVNAIVGGAQLSCCNVYGNSGGDWVGDIAGQYGINGNFSADPCFCDMPNDDYHLWNYSPCAQVGCGLIGALPVACTDPQGLGDHSDDPGAGSRFILDIAPNPFESSTTMSFSIPSQLAASPIHLDIYDATGRLIRNLVNATLPAGSHDISWNGTDQAGKAMKSGVYVYKLCVGSKSEAGRLLLIR
ncbi:right-handed parallel beta-helix repeat-containing protein [Candidatus Eisenbacteria bacterium]|uniref:Right-handed parallel beta-helix repeat-containing protein n=1 Tax=Eiseniibacteriota bacterium TaxID=2212470 RepID=A0ABV6YLT0_UNCEI